MVNVQKLKGKFVEHGYSTEQVAKGAKMTVSTLYRRLQKPHEFTIEEVDALTRFLGLDRHEANEIFFAAIVA